MSDAKKKILVVEDEPDIRELVRYNLEQAGFRVVEAEDGEAALLQVRSEQPALVVLDLMLPEGDGLEICRVLRGERQTAGLPIVMLTAKAAEVDRVLGLEFGADDYVTKPFSPRELLKFFVRNPNRVYDRLTILDLVWGNDTYVEPRTVDVHVRRLRLLVERDPANPELIHTVRGVGYKFNEQALYA